MELENTKIKRQNTENTQKQNNKNCSNYETDDNKKK